MARTSNEKTAVGARVTDADGRLVVVGANGGPVGGTVTTATTANVASSAASVTVFASNAAARARMLLNDSAALLYLKFGTTASSSSHTVQVAAGAVYVFPDPLYTGRVDGIWASADGFARTTELT